MERNMEKKMSERGEGPSLYDDLQSADQEIPLLFGSHCHKRLKTSYQRGTD